MDTREIERNLDSLLKLAEGYLARNDANNAASIYETVIEITMVNEDVALTDEDGELLGVVFDCAESLGEYLSKITGSKKRKEILQVLFSAYQWDTLKLGGGGAADCVPEILTSQTTFPSTTQPRSIPRGINLVYGYKFRPLFQD